MAYDLLYQPQRKILIMSKNLIALTLFVQILTVGVFFSLSEEDSQAYPMQAGYVMRDQNLQVVYFDGTPAELTYEQMETPIKRAHSKMGSPIYIKKAKNIRCERRDTDAQSTYRCALDMKKLPNSGV
jgi:hypothetical protein